MPRPIRNPKDLYTGVIYAVVGLGAVVIAHGYKMGTATHMGPAYFPTILGGLLMLIGVAAIVRSFLQPGEPLGGFAYKSVALILGALVLFGLLARTAGMVIAMLVLVLVASHASIKFRPWVALLLALGLTLFCVLTFVKALGVPLPLFGSWFGG